MIDMYRERFEEKETEIGEKKKKKDMMLYKRERRY